MIIRKDDPLVRGFALGAAAGMVAQLVQDSLAPGLGYWPASVLGCLVLVAVMIETVRRRDRP